MLRDVSRPPMLWQLLFESVRDGKSAEQVNVARASKGGAIEVEFLPTKGQRTAETCHNVAT